MPLSAVNVFNIILREYNGRNGTLLTEYIKHLVGVWRRRRRQRRTKSSLRNEHTTDTQTIEPTQHAAHPPARPLILARAHAVCQTKIYGRIVRCSHAPAPVRRRLSACSREYRECVHTVTQHARSICVRLAGESECVRYTRWAPANATTATPLVSSGCGGSAKLVAVFST